MTPESWILVALALMALTAVTRSLALLGVRGPWSLGAILFRVGAILVLAVVLALLVMASGEWSPVNWDQIVVALSLTMLVIYQVMAWGFQLEGAAPLVDLLALALVISSIFVHSPGDESVQTCIQGTVPVYLQWVLFLVGSAAAAILGSGGLLFGLQSVVGHRRQRGQWPSRDDLTFFLSQTTMVALLTLGIGLVLSVIWSWQVAGSLGNGGPRLTWMAITWLLAAMSSIAKRLPRHWAGLQAILGVATACAALYGLLAFPHLLVQF
jgi:hypothetical protein